MARSLKRKKTFAQLIAEWRDHARHLRRRIRKVDYVDQTSRVLMETEARTLYRAARQLTNLLRSHRR